MEVPSESEKSSASEEKGKVDKTEDPSHELNTNADETTSSAAQGEEIHADAVTVPPCFNTKTSLSKEVLLDRIRGTIYGNCIGDAIGLLTEFMTKAEATYIYGNYFEKGMTQKLLEKVTGPKLPNLEYSMKYRDFHRERFETGDWTDDSDQMILILQTLLENKGKIVRLGFAQKMKTWSKEGFAELGDFGGMGIGRTTHSVLRHPQFLVDPHYAASQIWESSGQVIAPNGGVMRTSILGVHDFGNIEAVIANTKEACQVTHADPRCVASCVAVTTAIALMLQGKHINEDGDYDVEAVIDEAFNYASEAAPVEELKKYMYADTLADLKLDESGKIGYTYKCMGSGFWSLRQKDFRASLEAIAYEGGDADTNGAVAGALLGCRLGASALPPSWLNGLKHKDWLDEKISKFLTLLGLNEEKEAKEKP